jgi:hypothetical protein
MPRPFPIKLGCARIMLFVRDPAPFLSPELSRDFHENIRDGNIDRMLELLEVEPALVHARNGDRATALMVATTFPDTQRAVELMKLLLDQGARLGCHDSSRRQTLLYACTHNVDCFVVGTLLQWNDQLGGTKFNWHDVDAGGRSALVLASGRANTAVTTLLLDKINIARYAKQNHPFRVLKAAIDSGNEPHALQVAQHRKIHPSLEEPEVTRYKGSGAPHLAWTISSCTEAAVDLGMLELVQVLNQLNRRKVARAVWYKMHKLSEDGIDVLATVPRVLLQIGMHFTSAWRWRHVRELCLVRYGRNQDELEGGLRLLVSLPGDVFHRIVAFVAPTAFQHPWDFVKRWCDCRNVDAGGKCRWHDMYWATRSDYYRLFN